MIGFAPLDGSGEPVVDRGQPRRQYPAFSPDGRWLAYEELVADQYQVFVRPLAGGPRHQISAEGGDRPRWTRGGRELVFRNGSVLYSASSDPATGEAGTPVRLFAKPDVGFLNYRTVSYDVTPDGSESLMVVPVPRPDAEPVVVTVNWLDELRKKVPR